MQARNVSRSWRRVVSVWTGLAIAGLFAACSDDEPVTSTPPATDAGSMEAFVPAPPAPTPPPPFDGSPPIEPGGPVPTTAAELFPWLQSRGYASWARESTVHPSAGPHGRVRVYVNPSLDSSLAAGNETHPVGAAAVKVLYERDDDNDDDDEDDVIGWAVMVKAAPGSGADTWYFYEIMSTTDPSSPVEGRGIPGCADCHSSGRDYFRSNHPLQ